MNRWKTTLAAMGLLCLGAALAGCSNTIGGAKQDAANDASSVRNAAKDTAAATKQAVDSAGAAAKNVVAASVLTPKVKLAIVRDPVLNDKRNRINVDTSNNIVHLTGHVLDDSEKTRATEDAQKVVSDNNSNAKVENDIAAAKTGA